MKMCSSIKRGIIALGLFLLTAGICVGSPTMYSGSLSVGDGGLTAYGAWNCPSTTLTWDVDNTTTPGLWHYSYTLTVQAKDISHIIIEASDGDNPFTKSNLFSPESYPAGWAANVSVQTFYPSASQPYMPESMYGIKFEGGGESTNVTLSFDSDRQPVWGDFYSKDGITPRDEWCVVYNTGFASADPITAAGSGALQNHLLVPDSYIPAPGALILVCIGTSITSALRRRRVI